MQYGKDPEQLKNIQPYGNATATQRMRYITQKKQNRPTGGSQYAKFFKLSEDRVDVIRLIPGDYSVADYDYESKTTQIWEHQPYFSHIEHYVPSQQAYITCSKGINWDQECLAHEVYLHDRRTQKGSERVGARRKNDFSILHYAPYHVVPQTDPNGNIRTNQQGKPYTTMMLDSPQSRAVAMETVAGCMLAWTVGASPGGASYQSVLNKHADYAENYCVGCGGFQTIRTVALCCPSCGTVLQDLSQVNVPLVEVQKMLAQMITCPHCRSSVLLSEQMHCPCGKPKRATLYDCDLAVTCAKANEGKRSSTILVVHQVSPPRPIQAPYDQQAKPLPLDTIFAPTPSDEQRRILQHILQEIQPPAQTISVPAAQLPMTIAAYQPPAATPPVQPPAFQPPTMTAPNVTIPTPPAVQPAGSNPQMYQGVIQQGVPHFGTMSAAELLQQLNRK